MYKHKLARKILQLWSVSPFYHLVGVSLTFQKSLELFRLKLQAQGLYQGTLVVIKTNFWRLNFYRGFSDSKVLEIYEQKVNRNVYLSATFLRQLVIFHNFGKS